MADIDWPEGLVPYKTMFYLQPHVGGQESPLTRTRKVYGLSAPRWVAKLTFRAGLGEEGVGLTSGPRSDNPTFYAAVLDAFIADMEGGLYTTRFHDFRRPRPQHYLTNYAQPATISAAAAIGATEVSVQVGAGNIGPSIGDYIGGDERPHIITGFSPKIASMTSIGPESGIVTLRFKPPLSAPLSAGSELEIGPVTARWRLTNETDGENEAEVGQPTEYVLEFTEELP